MARRRRNPSRLHVAREFLPRSSQATDKVLQVGVIAVGGYLVWKLFQLVTGIGEGATAIVKGVGTLPRTIGEAIGSGLFDLFHPDAAGESLYYTATFPDGARHAIPSGSVDAGGRFSYAGLRYQLVTQKETGLRVAVRTT